MSYSYSKGIIDTSVDDPQALLDLVSSIFDFGKDIFVTIGIFRGTMISIFI
jgi:hypothetical protein